MLLDDEIKDGCQSWIYSYSSPELFIKLLYNLGFAGLKRAEGIVFKSSESPLAMIPTIADDSIIVIHPTYVDALRLHNALVNRIGDDVLLRQSGIVSDLPESTSLGVYNAKLIALQTRLRELECGDKGAADYERLVEDVLRLCFHRAFTNIEAKSRDVSGKVTYSWEGEEHQEWVLQLASRLQGDGIQIIFDRWHLHPGQEKQHFMEQAVTKSDFVIVICTENYATRANNREGGVGYESMIITSEMADHILTKKFIPVLRLGSFATSLPPYINGRMGVDLRGTPCRTDEYDRLIRVLHGEPIQPPPIGKKPDFSSVPNRNPDKVVSTEVPHPRSLQCDLSPRAELVSKELSMRAFPVVQQCNWSEEIELSVLADTSEVDAIFSRLRGHKEHLIIAFGFDVAVAKLTTLNRISEGGNAVWKARFAPTRTEFCNDMEMGTSGTSADEFAEKRVRRLLLNEAPKSFRSSGEDFLGLANEAMIENLVQGLNSIVKIERSSFLDLYSEFGHDPGLFVEVAWIAAVADLKLSAAVEHVHHLRLELAADRLMVDFAGRRHRKYVNVPPYEITVKGEIGVATESTIAQDSPVGSTPSSAAQTEDSFRRQREARRLLAPELQRTIDRVLYIHGRALANFGAHSADSKVKPTDVKQDFIPHWPKLYPSAPQVRDLAEDDGAALTAYYDSLQALNDDVNDWWEREGQLPVNLFNTFRDKTSRCLRLALICIERFDLETLIPPPYESWGTISTRINQALKSEEQVLNAHLQRAQAKAAK